MKGGESPKIFDQMTYLTLMKTKSEEIENEYLTITPLIQILKKLKIPFYIVFSYPLPFISSPSSRSPLQQ